MMLGTWSPAPSGRGGRGEGDSDVRAIVAREVLEGRMTATVSWRTLQETFLLSHTGP
jgi:hypothetical protein